MVTNNPLSLTTQINITSRSIKQVGTRAYFTGLFLFNGGKPNQTHCPTPHSQNTRTTARGKNGKSLAQEMRPKNDISDHRSKGYFATWSLSPCTACKVSSYTKNENNLCFQKLDTEYFFIQQLVLGAHFPLYLLFYWANGFQKQYGSPTSGPAPTLRIS